MVARITTRGLPSCTSTTPAGFTNGGPPLPTEAPDQGRLGQPRHARRPARARRLIRPCPIIRRETTMSDLIAAPRLVAGHPRRTVLLTGASGVVGRALLERLRDVNVVCLVHRS